MAYLTFSEYQTYGGTVGEEAFAVEEFKARKRIDHLTDGRIEAMETVPEAVKLCMTGIINVHAASGSDALAAAPLVASYSTDGYSESYGSAADQTAALDRALNRQIREMLSGECDDSGVPLLFRGL